MKLLTKFARFKNSFRNVSRLSFLKFREGHLSTIEDNLSNNTAVETGAKTGWIVIDDLTPGFPTTPVPTSSTVLLKKAIPLMKNRTNGYPRGFRDFHKSKDKFVFCGELCHGDEGSPLLWSSFMIILHSFLLVSFIITWVSKLPQFSDNLTCNNLFIRLHRYWWQVWDVDDGFRILVTDLIIEKITTITKKVANIMILSPVS